VVVHEVHGRFAEDVYRSMLKEIRKRVGARFALTIQAIVLVRSGSLPRTTSGKVRRYVCQEYFRSSRLLIVSHSGHLESGAGETATPVTGPALI
jgi:acyl-coenzyme A synthetase/AMP-(fatty) acid ligase